MPRYGRRFGRRRRFGTRSRRYGRRRRPSAARAVPRSSLAPRQQYLKLKSVTQLTCMLRSRDGENQADAIPIELGLLYSNINYSPFAATPTQTPGNWMGTVPAEPLGYSAYKNLFQEYVMNAVKLRVQVNVNPPYGTVWYNSSGPAYGPAVVANATYARTYAPFADSEFSNDLTEWAAMPNGRMSLLSAGNTFRDKMYISMNKLWGTRVKNRDRFVRNWADTLGDIPADALANCMLSVWIPIGIADGTGGGSNMTNTTWTVSCTIQQTFYLTAQAVMSFYTPPAAMALASLKSTGALPAAPLGDPAPDVISSSSLKAAYTGVGAIDGPTEELVGRLKRPAD